MLTIQLLNWLKPLFACLDEWLDEHWLFLFVIFIHLLIPFGVWALTGGLRRWLMAGKPAPTVPPMIIIHLPATPPPASESFDPFLPCHEFPCHENDDHCPD